MEPFFLLERRERGRGRSEKAQFKFCPSRGKFTRVYLAILYKAPADLGEWELLSLRTQSNLHFFLDSHSYFLK
jgi:hypothetical protein